MQLFDRTIKLLSEYDGNVTQLCRDARVEKQWLDTVLRGVSRNPSVHKVQRLHDELVRVKKIEVERNRDLAKYNL